MDIVSHALWGTVIANKKPILLGLIFGAMPDIIGMGGLFGWRPYLIAHSLIALILVTMVTRKLFRGWVYGAAYGFHLATDVVTHSSGTRPLFYIPFLWRSIDPFIFEGWNWWYGKGLVLEILSGESLLVILVITKRFSHDRLNLLVITRITRREAPLSISSYHPFT